MVQWHRHILPILRHVSRSSSSFSHARDFHSHTIAHKPLLCFIRHLQSLNACTTRTTPLPTFSTQYQAISTSTHLLASSSDPGQVPVSSPLALLGTAKPEDNKNKPVTKPDKVQAVLKGIKQSPKKVNLVAALVRGMLVKDAVLQLQVSVKRAAKTVYQVIQSARANASHNHGLDPERLIVAEAFVGKGFFKKRISYHAKGRCGLKIRPECRLTVVVREITPEEEAEIARLRVHNFRKLTKRESRLVPHQLIETNPVWGRKSKSSGQNSSAAAA